MRSPIDALSGRREWNFQLPYLGVLLALLRFSVIESCFAWATSRFGVSGKSLPRAREPPP